MPRQELPFALPREGPPEPSTAWGAGGSQGQWLWVPGLALPAAPGPCRLQMDAIKSVLRPPVIAVSSARQHDPGSPHYTNHCHTNTIAAHIKSWCAPG